MALLAGGGGGSRSIHYRGVVHDAEASTMRKTLLVLMFVLLPSVAWAVGPIVSPQKCGLRWIAPTTNANNTPLTDLALYHVYVGTSAGVFPATPFATISAAAPAPTAGTNVAWDCRTAALPDGQKWATVRAVDLAGNESANAEVAAGSGGTKANGIPFVFDGVAPAAATGLEPTP